jgi:hypothetical protein
MERITAVYVRVSSRSQDLRSQEAELTRWAESQGAGAPIRWYQDKATGTKMERPAMDRLMADVTAGTALAPYPRKQSSMKQQKRKPQRWHAVPPLELRADRRAEILMKSPCGVRLFKD